MSLFEVLAQRLVADVPISRLQGLLGRHPDDPTGFGVLCGGGCGSPPGHQVGFACGFGCREALAANAQDVIDPDGALKLTADDLADVRKDLPKLRNALIYEIETHLRELG